MKKNNIFFLLCLLLQTSLLFCCEATKSSPESPFHSGNHLHIMAIMATIASKALVDAHNPKDEKTKQDLQYLANCAKLMGLKHPDDIFAHNLSPSTNTFAVFFLPNADLATDTDTIIRDFARKADSRKPYTEFTTQCISENPEKPSWKIQATQKTPSRGYLIDIAHHTRSPDLDIDPYPFTEFYLQDRNAETTTQIQIQENYRTRAFFSAEAPALKATQLVMHCKQSEPANPYSSVVKFWTTNELGPVSLDKKEKKD